MTIVKNTASGLQNSIDTINRDISDIQEQLKNVKPDPNAGREYDITYEDSKLSLLENGTVKTQVVIQGGGGGGYYGGIRGTAASSYNAGASTGGTSDQNAGDGYCIFEILKAKSLPFQFKINGSIKEVSEGYVKVNGVWKPLSEGYCKISSNWKN